MLLSGKRQVFVKKSRWVLSVLPAGFFISSFFISSLLIFSLLISSISGCGFHLKGLQQAESLSIYPVYENVSPGFQQELQHVLLENGVLSENIQTADIKVTFKNERWQRRSLSVSDTGIPAEYRLRYVLSYSFQKQGVQNPEIENQNTEKYREISESRDFKSNNSQLLAIDSEQKFLKRQIQQRVARQIINNIR